MKAVVTRVKEASVTIEGEVVGQISQGFLILLGITHDDTPEACRKLAEKVLGLRVFTDENDKMNLSLLDIQGEVLLISQFTLYGDARKGRRPNFMNALGGEEAKKFYDKFIEMMKETGLKVQTGIFGADMKVMIENDGPVTIILETNEGNN